jgi:hypothetical protein
MKVPVDVRSHSTNGRIPVPGSGQPADWRILGAQLSVQRGTAAPTRQSAGQQATGRRTWSNPKPTSRPRRPKPRSRLGGAFDESRNRRSPEFRIALPQLTTHAWTTRRAVTGPARFAFIDRFHSHFLTPRPVRICVYRIGRACSFPEDHTHPPEPSEVEPSEVDPSEASLRSRAIAAEVEAAGIFSGASRLCGGGGHLRPQAQGLVRERWMMRRTTSI